MHEASKLVAVVFAVMMTGCSVIDTTPWSRGVGEEDATDVGGEHNQTYESIRGPFGETIVVRGSRTPCEDSHVVKFDCQPECGHNEFRPCTEVLLSDSISSWEFAPARVCWDYDYEHSGPMLKWWNESGGSFDGRENGQAVFELALSDANVTVVESVDESVSVLVNVTQDVAFERVKYSHHTHVKNTVLNKTWEKDVWRYGPVTDVRVVGPFVELPAC